MCLSAHVKGSTNTQEVRGNQHHPQGGVRGARKATPTQTKGVRTQGEETAFPPKRRVEGPPPRRRRRVSTIILPSFFMVFALVLHASLLHWSGAAFRPWLVLPFPTSAFWCSLTHLKTLKTLFENVFRIRIIIKIKVLSGCGSGIGHTGRLHGLSASCACSSPGS